MDQYGKLIRFSVRWSKALSAHSHHCRAMRCKIGLGGTSTRPGLQGRRGMGDWLRRGQNRGMCREVECLMIRELEAALFLVCWNESLPAVRTIAGLQDVG